MAQSLTWIADLIQELIARLFGMQNLCQTFQRIRVTEIDQNRSEADQDTIILNLTANVLPSKGHLHGKIATVV